MKFTEEKLEKSVNELLWKEGPSQHLRISLVPVLATQTPRYYE